MQILDNKKCRYFCILAISLIYFLRIIYIDADVPAWGVSTYMPIDEGIYAELALNLLTFGSIDPNQYFQGQYEFLVSAQATINVFGNLVTYVTLLLFGDNYFGKCAKVCGMGCDPVKQANDLECIRCGDCKRACPTQAIHSGCRK